MPGRVFVFLLISLTTLAILTNPPLARGLASYVQADARPSPTLSPTATPTPTATRDPFAYVPTATPLGRRITAVDGLPTPAVGALPLALTPAPTLPVLTGLLPDTLATPRPITATNPIDIPPAPTPAGIPPDRLSIPRLNLDVPIEPVGMAPSDVAPGVVEWGVPEHRAAGWLNTSAPFGRPGNTVLDGHHNIKGEVFRDLWTLQARDVIFLAAGDASQRYVVDEVLILPERDQPLDVRLRNAGYIQPTEDERLTLVTCWPYDDNSHRTLVVARPRETP